jgi:hypothetical protein
MARADLVGLMDELLYSLLDVRAARRAAAAGGQDARAAGLGAVQHWQEQAGAALLELLESEGVEYQPPPDGGGGGRRRRLLRVAA